MTSLPFPELPENALIVLIGASGAGKSTLSRTWPASQVLSLDALRGAVSDDPGCQEATGDAVSVLHLLVDRRMARRRNTVVDATNVTTAAREPLVAAAKRHNMPAVAIVVATPESVCVSRQVPRPDNRTVPDDKVRAQHKAMIHSQPNLAAEGFNQVVCADRIHRLEPFFRRLSDVRKAALGLDCSDGLGDLFLPRQFFGPEILPMWRWMDGSDVAGGDRVAEIRLGPQHLTLALCKNADGQGDYGFDVMVPCPFDPECSGYTWAPATSISCLHRALTGELNNDEDTFCTVHGGFDDVDQEADDHTLDHDIEGRADLEAQALEAVRG
ncbi:AAA family ATPase [Streptomyces mirabilis]